MHAVAALIKVLLNELFQSILAVDFSQQANFRVSAYRCLPLYIGIRLSLFGTFH